MIAYELLANKLTSNELDEQSIVELPSRMALSLVNANAAIPINAAVAANVLSDSSVAEANATQNTPINQDI
jgi:hypothetical protein